MSKEEEVFKQQLDAMLSTQSFEMGADNWSGMELLLKQQQRKRRGFFILFTGIGVFLISSLVWLLMPQTHSNTPVSATKAVIENSKSDFTPVEQIAGKELNPALSNLEKISVSNAPKIPTKKIQPQPIKTSTTDVPQTPSVKSDSFAHPSSTQTSNNAQVSNSASSSNAAVENTKVNETKTNNEATAGNAAENSTSDMKTPPVLIETAASAIVPQPVPETKIEETIRTTTLAQEQETLVTMKDEIVSPLELKPDTVVALAAKPDTDYVAKKQFSYLLEAGLTGLTGWQENGQRDAAGINPLFGAHVSYPLTSELEVAIGLQYTTVGHLKYSKYTATTSHLDLGRIEQSLVFTPTRLHYLLLPLKASLKLDKKQSIGAGLTLGYLLTADSKVENYTYNYFGRQLISSEKKKGYTEGFRNFDAQISANYKYSFNADLQLQLCLIFGLMDVKTGEALPSAGFERNSGATISLLYTLFKK